jgi:hypothetical protein
MKKHLSIGLCLLAVFACAVPDDPASQVLQLELQRFQAMVTKDIDFLDYVISEDLYYIHSNGDIDDKESVINPISSGERSYEDISMDNPKIRIYDNTAIINAECTYHRTGEDGHPNNLTLLYTNVYVKKNDGWKMVTWQSFKKE